MTDHRILIPLMIPVGYGDNVRSVEIKTRIYYRLTTDLEPEVIWAELDKDDLQRLAGQIDVTQLPGPIELKLIAEVWIGDEGYDMALENARNGGWE